MLGLLEVEYIVVGFDGLQTENLNQRAGFLAEVQTRLNDFRVVENHQSTWARQVVRKGGEMCFTDFVRADTPAAWTGRGPAAEI